MNNYLIFRTDRIGDFLVSAILIKSIKFNDPDSYITVVSSKKNYEYIKSFKYIDQVVRLDNNFLSKIKVIFKLRKHKLFQTIIVHDNKNRSKIISRFLNTNKRIILKDIEKYSHIDIIKYILNKINFDFKDKSLNIIDKKRFINVNKEKYILLHFDEKWIHKEYIKEYINIEPSESELTFFLKSLQNKSKKKLVVTSGVKTPLLLKESIKKLKNINIEFLDKINFIDLEVKILNSDLLISCHGSVSHVASANSVRQLDIIDKSYNYSRWTKHFRNYDFIYRDNFTKLSKEILRLI